MDTTTPNLNINLSDPKNDPANPASLQQAQPIQQSPQQSEYDPKAVAMTRAIRMQENGGKISPDNYTTPGKTGELPSAYQFEPEFWKTYAGKVLGDPNAPLTPENQDKVAYGAVKEQIDAGKQPYEIASWWNSGDYGAYNDPGIKHPGNNVQQYTQNTLGYLKQVAQQMKAQQPAQSNQQPGSNLPGWLSAAAYPFTAALNGLQGSLQGVDPQTGQSLGAGQRILRGVGALGTLAASTLPLEGAATGLLGKAGIEAASPLLRGATEGLLSGAALGGSAGIAEGKSAGQVAAQAGEYGLGGGIAGGVLGKIFGSILPEITSNPEAASVFEKQTQQAVNDMKFSLGESQTGMNILGDPAKVNTLESMMKDGYFPLANETGTRFDTTVPYQAVRQDIGQLQDLTSRIRDSISDTVPLSDLEKTTLKNAQTYYANDLVALKEQTAAIKNEFKNLKKVYKKPLTAEDIYNLQNSENIKNYSKWERSPEAITQSKGKTARAMYSGLKDTLNKIDKTGNLAPANERLSQLHDYEKLLSPKSKQSLHGKSIKTPDTRSFLKKLASRAFSIATTGAGATIGSAFGAPTTGAIIGEEAGQRLGGQIPGLLKPKTKFGTPEFQTIASKLRGK